MKRPRRRGFRSSLEQRNQRKREDSEPLRWIISLPLTTPISSPSSSRRAHGRAAAAEDGPGPASFASLSPVSGPLAIVYSQLELSDVSKRTDYECALARRPRCASLLSYPRVGLRLPRQAALRPLDIKTDVSSFLNCNGHCLVGHTALCALLSAAAGAHSCPAAPPRRLRVPSCSSRASSGTGASIMHLRFIVVVL